MRQHVLLRCVIGFFVLLFAAQNCGAAESFTDWLHTFRREAEAEGIERITFAQAFSGVTEPDNRVLQNAAYQPEFTQQVWEYLDTRVNSLSIEQGRAMAARYPKVLHDIEQYSGVSASILLAIWSMETNYGSILAKKERLHYLPRALATLGWGDAKRKKFAKTQLVAALKIFAAGDVTRADFLSSWAGAMGHTQFIPTSYLAYAVDFDGDGRRDVWNSVADALASSANLLSRNGWRTGKTWGYEVVLGEGFKKYQGQTKTLRQWQQLGFVRPQQKNFPRPDEKAVLKILGGGNGPGFLMLRNFFVLKKYNNSDFYALAVGLLADRLAGWQGMVQQWPKPPGVLSFAEKLELQSLLKQRGYYNAAVDGYPGKMTRAAVRAFQQDHGLEVRGRADKSTLEQLRKLPGNH